MVAPAPRNSGYGLRQACRAERAKLFSIRSTWWTCLSRSWAPSWLQP